MVAVPVLVVAAFGAATITTASAGGAATTGAGSDRAGVMRSLRADLDKYLADRGKIDHISAVELEVDFAGHQPRIDMTAGTTTYGGHDPVRPGALWQIGSNTKAYTSVLLLQLEAQGKLSIHDTLGKWLPQYPAWRDITIEHLLNMTSRIPDYTEQPDFLNTLTTAPDTVFSAARLVSYVENLPLGKVGYHYSNTDYILAQMIIERAGHDTYAHQLAQRITGPLRLRNTCFAPYTCPAGTADQMPAGYDTESTPPSPIPPLALTWGQGAGGIVASLRDMTTWDRALYTGAMVSPRQQHEMDTLVYPPTGQPLPVPTTTEPLGYGLGVIEANYPPVGLFWTYEGGTAGYRVWHLYAPKTGIAIAIGLNSDANSLDDNPADTGPDQDTVDQLGFAAYRAVTRSGDTPAGR